MIDREKVIKGLGCCADQTARSCKKCPYDFRGNVNCMGDMATDALAILQEQEAVVRCKDCKYWYFADNRIPCERENVCGRNGIVVTPEWFCADGERAVKS